VAAAVRTAQLTNCVSYNNQSAKFVLG